MGVTAFWKHHGQQLGCCLGSVPWGMVLTLPGRSAQAGQKWTGPRVHGNDALSASCRESLNLVFKVLLNTSQKSKGLEMHGLTKAFPFSTQREGINSCFCLFVSGRKGLRQS